MISAPVTHQAFSQVCGENTAESHGLSQQLAATYLMTQTNIPNKISLSSEYIPSSGSVSHIPKCPARSLPPVTEDMTEKSSTF